MRPLRTLTRAACLPLLICSSLPSLINAHALATSMFVAEEDTRVSEVSARIEQLLAPQQSGSSKTPTVLRELIKQFRQFEETNYKARMDVARALAKDDAFVNRVVADLPPGPLGPIWSTKLRENVRVDTDLKGWFPSDDVLGTGFERSLINRFFDSAAAVAEERGDVKRAAELRVVMLRYVMADPFDMAGSSMRLLQMSKKRNVSVGELLGITDHERAERIAEELQALHEAWSSGAKVYGTACLSCDRALKQLADGSLNDDDFETAIEDINTFWNEAAPNNYSVSWCAANLLYRLRATTALKGSPEQLARIDANIDELINDIDFQPQKRWLQEAKTLKPALFASSGVNVVRDPNDARVKGAPPQ